MIFKKLKIFVLCIVNIFFSYAQNPTLLLSLSNDTLNVYDTLLITNISTGFSPDDAFYIEVDELTDDHGMYRTVKNTYPLPVNEVKIITYHYPGRYTIRLFHSGQSLNRQVMVTESSITYSNVIDSSYSFCKNQIENESFERRLRIQNSGYDNLFNTTSQPCNNSTSCINFWQNHMPNICGNGINGLGTADYFTGFLWPGQNLDYRVPQNIWGFQTAYDDKSYAGIYTTSQLNYAESEWREFIYQNLSQPLQANIPYYASMWVSLAERTNLATRVQMALLDSPCQLTTTAIDTGQFKAPVNRIISSPGYVTDRDNWVKVSGFYTPANNNTKLLMIGMFNDVPGQAISIPIASGYSLGTDGKAAYYYIDYVTLKAVTCCAAKIPQNNRLIGQNNNRISTLGFTINSGDTLVIADTLIIDQNTTFHNNLVVIMQNGTIRVNSGVTLTITHSHLRGCDEMWKGIEVLPGGTVTMTNSLLEDAITGISSSQGAPVSIHQSILRNNLTHILLRNFSGVYPFTLTASILECTANLKFPYGYYYKTLYGIKSENAGIVVVGNANDPALKNTFKDAWYGIFAYQTNITVKNNLFHTIKCFSNQLCNADQSSAAIFINNAKNLSSIIANIGGDAANEPNEFSDCRTGIFITHNVHANIIRNRFDNVGYRGISVRRCLQNLIVIRNNIMKVQRWGVYLENNANARIYIQRNSIKSYATPVMPGNTYGIYAIEPSMNSQQNVRLIEYNIIHGYNHGIYFSVCYNPQIWNNHIHEDGQITALKHGIWLQACFVPIVARNTIHGQLFTNMSYGIRQDNSPVSQTICNDVELKTIDLSHNGYSLASTLGANYMRNSMVGILVSQGSLGNQGDNGLAHMNGWFPYNTNPSPWLAHILYNNFNTNDFYELRIPGSPWYPNNFKYLDNNFSPIYNTNSFNSLTQIAPFVYGCRVLNWSTGDTTGTSAGNEATLMRLLHDNDSLLADSLSAWWMGQSSLYKLVIRQEEEISNPQLALFKQTWDTTASAQLAQWEKWMAEMTDSLPEFNWQAVQPTQSSDEHHKLVLQVYDQWLRTDSLAQEKALISQHAQALENVARLCPYEEGDAVYMARNLLRILYPDTLFTDTCETFWLPIYDAKISANSQISQELPCYMQIYPVPANHELTLDIACMMDEVNGVVKIWSLNGQLVHQQLVSHTMTRITLPVTAWKQGLYLYELFINEEKVHYGKLEILH